MVTSQSLIQWFEDIQHGILPSFNDQEKCVELSAASVAIFLNKYLITIVQTIVPSQSLVRCIKDIDHNGSTKFE